MISMMGMLVSVVTAALVSVYVAGADDINAFFGNVTDSPPAVALTNETRSEWELYKGEIFVLPLTTSLHITLISILERHSKHYSTAVEDNRHRRAFLRSQARSHAHNERYARGEVRYRLAAASNPVADLTPAEYSRLNGFRGTTANASRAVSHASRFLAPMNVGSLPASVDWRTQGYVTGVKSQGQCGDCWAFSATGSLEGQHMRATGSLVSLSEQNLADCSRAYGNEGCEGGWIDSAFEYIKDNGGVDTESYYPYRGVDETQCSYSSSAVGATASGYVNVPSGDEQALMQAVATVGPVSVAIDASPYSFQVESVGP
jgi:cathepsin L